MKTCAVKRWDEERVILGLAVLMCLAILPVCSTVSSSTIMDLYITSRKVFSGYPQ